MSHSSLARRVVAIQLELVANNIRNLLASEQLHEQDVPNEVAQVGTEDNSLDPNNNAPADAQAVQETTESSSETHSTSPAPLSDIGVSESSSSDTVSSYGSDDSTFPFGSNADRTEHDWGASDSFGDSAPPAASHGTPDDDDLEFHPISDEWDPPPTSHPSHDPASDQLDQQSGPEASVEPELDFLFPGAFDHFDTTDTAALRADPRLIECLDAAKHCSEWVWIWDEARVRATVAPYQAHVNQVNKEWENGKKPEFEDLMWRWEQRRMITRETAYHKESERPEAYVPSRLWFMHLPPY
ncbi:hypothetical protein JX266_002296 [Neoarthrinium moseri]|nr:hypothetical protein JX266_002296 [Neoarthrinium moseri]